MPLDRPIETITEADLSALVDAGVPELRTLDYKQTLPGNSDEQRKEFLADVASFANCAGGHLIYGMREEDGVPVELSGLDEDMDGTLLRLESMIRDGIAPRILVHSAAIPFANGRIAVVVRVPKSFSAPHMVVFKGNSRFFSRASNGKYQMDVHQIRQGFLGSEAASAQLRNFRLDRVSQIRAREMSVPLRAQPCTALHIIPLNTFTGGARYDLTPLKANALIHQNLAPLFRDFANNSRINFDGILLHDAVMGNEGSYGFTQIYRTGVIETVDAYLISASESYGKGKIFPGLYFEVKLLRCLSRYLAVMKSLRVDPPLAIMVALIDVKGYAVGYEQFAGYLGGGEPFDRDVLLPQEVVADSYDDELPPLMKPIFDELWNASGYSGSRYYKDGKWTGEDEARKRGGI